MACSVRAMLQPSIPTTTWTAGVMRAMRAMEAVVAMRAAAPHLQRRHHRQHPHPVRGRAARQSGTTAVDRLPTTRCKRSKALFHILEMLIKGGVWPEQLGGNLSIGSLNIRMKRVITPRTRWRQRINALFGSFKDADKWVAMTQTTGQQRTVRFIKTACYVCEWRKRGRSSSRGA